MAKKTLSTMVTIHQRAEDFYGHVDAMTEGEERYQLSTSAPTLAKLRTKIKDFLKKNGLAYAEVDAPDPGGPGKGAQRRFD